MLNSFLLLGGLFYSENFKWKKKRIKNEFQIGRNTQKSTLEPYSFLWLTVFSGKHRKKEKVHKYDFASRSLNFLTPV